MHMSAAPPYQKTIVSGTRATGGLHLGNYIGALSQWVKMTNETEADTRCFFFVADLHAITTPFDPKELAHHTREITAAYIAAGLDLSKVTLFAQSAVPHHPYLQWLFGSVAQMGWLKRMTQFKEKAGKKQEMASLALFAYPVLQAADVLVYKATHVPVGEDQKQHIELSRDIAGGFNHVYGEVFPLPKPIILKEGARIMSLRDGTSKMSKSAESDMSRINLLDDAETIAQKIRKAKTDMHPVPAAPEEYEDRPEAKNLLMIYSVLSAQSMSDVMAQYGGKQFSEFKPALADLAVEKLSPVTAEMTRLMNDPAEIDRVLVKGTETAAPIAAEVLEEAVRAMGFWKAMT